MNSNDLVEQTVSVTTKDGKMETFISYPESMGPFPVVLIYMDSVGFREELRNFARRFALNGYYAILPNLYYRAGGPSFDPYEPFKFSDQILPLAYALNNNKVMNDTAAILYWVSNETAASSGAKGCVGYCMGGRMALAATGTFPDEFIAAASLYGGRQVTDADDSPHLIAMRSKGEIYLGFAEFDKHVPEEQVQKIDAAFRNAGVNYTLERYPESQHGFAFPERVFYHDQSAELSWERILDLFQRKLKKASDA